MSQIEVQAVSNRPNDFKVTVSEGGSSSDFQVHLPDEVFSRLSSGKISKIDCIKASFRFLLDREPKESILREFEIPIISRYFPDFEAKFKNYVEK